MASAFRSGPASTQKNASSEAPNLWKELMYSSLPDFGSNQERPFYNKHDVPDGIKQDLFTPINQPTPLTTHAENRMNKYEMRAPKRHLYLQTVLAEGTSFLAAMLCVRIGATRMLPPPMLLSRETLRRLGMLGAFLTTGAERGLNTSVASLFSLLTIRRA
jgi:hypothetical protein